MSIDEDRLNKLLNTFVTDLGATMAAGSVVVGHRLGLYRSLAEAPATAAQLARRTDTDPRYVAEWLAVQAAGKYVTYHPGPGWFSLTEEQAFALADPDGPLYLPGAFMLALGALRAESQIADAIRTGAGLGWTSTTRTCSRTATRPLWTSPGSGPPRPASPTEPASRSPPRRRSPGPAMTSSRASTACTTWATRSARPGTSGRRSTPTVPG